MNEPGPRLERITRWAAACRAIGAQEELHTVGSAAHTVDGVKPYLTISDVEWLVEGAGILSRIVQEASTANVYSGPRTCTTCRQLFAEDGGDCTCPEPTPEPVNALVDRLVVTALRARQGYGHSIMALQELGDRELLQLRDSVHTPMRLSGRDAWRQGVEDAAERVRARLAQVKREVVSGDG